MSPFKQAYGFRDREYFKLKIYPLPEISGVKRIWIVSKLFEFFSFLKCDKSVMDGKNKNPQ